MKKSALLWATAQEAQTASSCLCAASSARSCLERRKELISRHQTGARTWFQSLLIVGEISDKELVFPCLKCQTLKSSLFLKHCPPWSWTRPPPFERVWRSPGHGRCPGSWWWSTRSSSRSKPKNINEKRSNKNQRAKKQQESRNKERGRPNYLVDQLRRARHDHVRQLFILMIGKS